MDVLTQNMIPRQYVHLPYVHMLKKYAHFLMLTFIIYYA
jgi:hypothetical protein